MRLLKTHSHTSDRLGYEADKKGQEKQRRPIRKEQENVNENHRHITCEGGRGENVSTEARKVEVAPQP